MIKCTSKADALKESLLTEISKLPAGGRLPTVKGIMHRYRVSQATVDRALRFLKDNGYVETTVGRGIFASSRRPADVELQLERVDLLLFSNRASLDRPGFHSELVDHLGNHLGQTGVWLRTTALPYRATAGEVASSIEKLRPQALLLVNVSSSDVVDVIRRRNLPFVSMFPSGSVEVSNSVLIDNNSIARHWIEHLAGLGHRKIAYLHGLDEEYPQRDQRQRVQFFYEEMGRAGLVADPDIVFFGGHTRRRGCEAARKLFERGKEFTAIVCNDSIASGVYDVLHEVGIEPGKDMSVIGVDDCQWAAHMHPPLTTVRTPRNRLAALAIRQLKVSIQDKKKAFSRILVSSDLIVRESTGPLTLGGRTDRTRGGLK